MSSVTDGAARRPDTGAARPGSDAGDAGTIPHEAGGGLRIFVLGGFRASIGEREVEPRAWRLNKAKDLVKLLALAPRRRLHREQLLDLLWPDLDPSAAANNLNQALFVARRTLEPGLAHGPSSAYLHLQDELVSLDPAVWVDAEAFEAAAAAARHGGDPAAYRGALDLYAGDLLPEDRYEDWASERRDELQSTFTGLERELARLLGARRWSADGRPSSAVPEPTTHRAHNLPRRLTSFVGRGAEIDAVQPLVRQNGLLTLTGAGGSGKSSLALQVARGVLNAFPGGIWLVELAALRDPALVPPAVAAALGVHIGPNRSLDQALEDFLRGKRALLLLDNCEHLVEACAALVAGLLSACPDLHVVTTSREVLGVPGEVRWPVPPLALPLASERNVQPTPVEKLLGYDAIHLFVDRARASRPGFALTAQNAPAVVRICRRLDGLPLAIELAAARVALLPVEEIAARLDDRFALLTGGGRTAPPRQQTLQAAVRWSYDSLSPQERAILNRLSVFAGSWTATAAEAVCAGLGIERREVLDVLSRLVAKSLLVADAPSPSGRGSG